MKNTDLSILKKKLNTYKSLGGRIKVSGVDEELLLEILTQWEHWTGTASSFYRAIGSSHRQIGSIIGRAKKIKREGHFSSSFSPLGVIEATSTHGTSSDQSSPIILRLKNKQLIKFFDVTQVIDFLNRHNNSSSNDEAA